MNKFVSFLLGMATGGTVAYLFLKKRFDKKLDETLELELTNFYSKNGGENTVAPQHIPDNSTDPLSTYSEDSDKDNFVDYTKYFDPVPEVSVSEESTPEDDKNIPTEEDIYIDENGPIVIAAFELGLMPGYEIIDLTYYKDAVLADDLGNVIKSSDYDLMFGEDALTPLTSYDDDSVFIRDDNKKVYYSILRTNMRYSEITW